jgi:hypothetical protein
MIEPHTPLCYYHLRGSIKPLISGISSKCIFLITLQQGVCHHPDSLAKKNRKIAKPTTTGGDHTPHPTPLSPCPPSPTNGEHPNPPGRSGGVVSHYPPKVPVKMAVARPTQRVVSTPIGGMSKWQVGRFT